MKIKCKYATGGPSPRLIAHLKVHTPSQRVCGWGACRAASLTRVIVIPANGAVAFPIGATIIIRHNSGHRPWRHRCNQLPRSKADGSVQAQVSDQFDRAPPGIMHHSPASLLAFTIYAILCSVNERGRSATTGGNFQDEYARRIVVGWKCARRFRWSRRSPHSPLRLPARKPARAIIVVTARCRDEPVPVVPAEVNAVILQPVAKLNLRRVEDIQAVGGRAPLMRTSR